MVDLNEIQGSWDEGIVVLSILIAVLGSYISLDISQHIPKAHREMKRIWLSMGSITMGLSIWAMHFIGMTALRLNVEVYYDWLDTFLSILPAFGAAFIAFYLINRTNVNTLQILGSGVFMALAIVTMHYSGMQAMVIPGVEMVYDEAYVTLSIGIALFVSIVALFLFKRIQSSHSTLIKIGSALLMGMAISSMHYVAMKATHYQETADYIFFPSQVGNKEFLILSVSVIMTVVLMAVILMNRMENRHALQIAHYDLLTKLPNRSYFVQQYEYLLKRARKNETMLSCILFDVDHFKRINDTFGYEAGDRVLQQIAQQMKGFQNKNIIIARLDGNRFGLLIQKEKSLEDLNGVLERIQLKFDQLNFSHGQFEFHPTLSIGASVKEFAPDIYDDLFIQAEQALHYAKNQGRNNFQLYNPEVHSQKRENLIINELKQAVSKEELSLYFQPKITVKSMQAEEAEVLLRWNSEKLGMISPGEFIPIAEKNGLIVEISEYVLRSAFKQLKEWEDTEFPICCLAINISPVHFQYGNIYQMLVGLIEDYQVDPSKVELEITETSVMKNIDQAVQTLESLRELGFRIALDDFGTGLSSLNYLQQLPIDTLKIDRTFVNDLDQDTTKQAIVKTVIQLANHLGAKVTVEGVETKQQAHMLQLLHCDHLQGYYFYKPMPCRQLEKVCDGEKVHM